MCRLHFLNEKKKNCRELTLGEKEEPSRREARAANRRKRNNTITEHFIACQKLFRREFLSGIILRVVFIFVVCQTNGGVTRKKTRKKKTKQ